MRIQDLFDLSNQTAIITGGGGDLGRQIAKALFQAGANIVICSRNIDNCESACNEINELGGSALALQVDVTHKSSVKRLVSEVQKAFGSIEILVNCSGKTGHAPAEEFSHELWEEIVSTNLTGVFYMSQEVGKQMIKNGYGKIVNISSVAGLRGYEPESHNSVAYTSSKGAVHTLTKDLAVKWGPHGVFVNAVAPGVFITKMNRSRLQPKIEKLKESNPLRKLGGDDDLIGAVLYFASPASNYTTGQILAVDGGSSAK
ncbi:SDR family NAD(P)-dependent oxidoreductase [Oceanobacillus sp. CF4.6]|uniref:SDR family NAD(P)-dependent oxidoreductase n=1 Tax=Oceanobacillus sp. CF4.6 TaxID=3373080 RepID=UPI003EE482C2